MRKFLYSRNFISIIYLLKDLEYIFSSNFIIFFIYLIFDQNQYYKFYFSKSILFFYIFYYYECIQNCGLSQKNLSYE